MRGALARWGAPAAVALLVLGAWTALSTRVSPVLLPSPADVVRALVDERGRLLTATAQTARAALLGLLAATGVGTAGAVLFLRSRTLERALQPYALLVQTLPVVAIAPLLVVWLGYGTPVATGAAALVAFFPMLTAVHAGLVGVDPDQVALLRLYGASWTQELLRLRLPAALPSALTGLRTAGGLAVIGAIVGEFVGSNGQPPSLGYLVLRGMRSAETGLIFAAVGCAAGLALLLFAGVRLLAARLVGPWHPGGTR